MKINIASPTTGLQKVFEIEDDKKLTPFYDKRMSTEVDGGCLGDEWKGYIFKISGGNDKQGFPMKQGILSNQRVRLLLKKGTSCYRERRTGTRKRRSVRGCIVGPDLAIMNLVIVKKGAEEVPGLTDDNKPRRLGPKRAANIRIIPISTHNPPTAYTMLRPILVSALAVLASSESSCITSEDGNSCADAIVGSSMIQQRKVTTPNQKAPALVEIEETMNSTDSPSEWTTAVNDKRANHGACPLEWAEPLAQGIKEWVDGLTSLHHADSYHIPPPGGPAGENLAWASNGVTVQQSVDMWYNEVNDCATPPPGCQQPKPGRMTGHFTAMVWKGARTMGCAISNNGQYSGCRWKAGDRLSADTPNMAMPGLYEQNVGATGETPQGC